MSAWKQCYGSTTEGATPLDLLTRHLLDAGVLSWPLSDGLTVEDLQACYFAAAAAGLVPGRDELQRHRPDLADALAAFFAGPPPSPDS